MLDWFGKRKRAQVAQQQAAATEEVLISPDVLALLAVASPVPEREAAATVPAALEALDRRRPAETPGSRRTVPHGSLSWLLAAEAPREGGALTSAEASLLHRLDAQLVASALPSNLLPRAPAVVPQLMGLLRRELPTRTELARLVTKDVLLTAEVLRVAGSAAYGMRSVDRLEDALDRIGNTGLQQAMARVLVKPMFQAQAGGLTARAAPRVWLYAEAKSAICAELAQHAEQRFEAFLAGLMHDTGWIALLRLVDRGRLALPLPFSDALDTELDRRKDRLFGRLTAEWGLTAGLTQLAQRFAAGDLAAAGDPLAELLRQADRLCLAHLSNADPQAPQ